MMIPVPPSWPGIDDFLSMMIPFRLANLELLWSVLVFGGLV